MKDSTSFVGASVCSSSGWALKTVEPKTIKRKSKPKVAKKAAKGLFCIKSLVFDSPDFKAEKGFLKLIFLIRSVIRIRCSKIRNLYLPDFELVFFIVK